MRFRSPDDVHLSTDATGARVVIDLPGLHVDGDGSRPAALPARRAAAAARRWSPRAGAARVESWFSALPGTARLELELDGTRTPLKLVLEVGSGRHGHPGPLGAQAAGHV